MQWTDSQLQAIETRDANLLVSAAAGSGKTTVLVERIIRLITDGGADVERMLVVTFTKAAAANMRAKITRALAKSTDPRVRKQLPGAGRASIKTIHAFCMDVIRQYFYVLGLDPMFRVADTTEAALLFQEAMNEIFEEGYAAAETGEDALLRIVERFSGDKAGELEDRTVRKLTEDIYTFMKAQANPKEWLENAVAMYGCSEEDFGQSAWASSALELLRFRAEGACGQLRMAVQRAELAGCEKGLQIVNNELVQAQWVRDAATLEDAQARLKAVRFDTLRKEKQVDQFAFALIRELRQTAKDELQALQKLFAQPVLETVCMLNAMKDDLYALMELVLRLDERYGEKKRKKGIIDFDDQQHLAIDLLSRPEIAEELRQRFDFIFVDEYQDSNAVQETLVNLIRREDNLFLVGDVKQSIYRFRLADPTLFMDKMERYTGGRDVRVDLNNNFRSDARILNGVNFVFRNIMTRGAAEIDYDDQAALYPAMDGWQHGCEQKCDRAPCQQDEAAVEFHFVLKERGASQAELSEGESTEEVTTIQFEAQLAAQKLHVLKDRLIYDPSKGECRPARWRDMVILMRSLAGSAEQVEEILLQNNIPVYREEEGGFYQAQEVRVVLTLLRVLDNRRQDTELLTVLRSFGGFNEQELLEIRAFTPEGEYCDAVKNYLEEANDLSARLSTFLTRVERWAFASGFLPMDRLLWLILEESGYLDYISCLPGGTQRKANVQLLVDKAIQFEKSELHGIFAFLSYVDRLRQGGGDSGTARTLGEGDDVVRIMSVHKSKGLEFPLVLVLGIGKKRPNRTGVLRHKDLGLAMRYVDPERRIMCDTLPQKIMNETARAEDVAEEMRILYVAMTRAVNGLYLYGTQELGKSALPWYRYPGSWAVSRAQSALDWFGMLLLRHPDGQPLRDRLIPDLIPDEDIELIYDESQWQVELHTFSPISEKEQRARQLTAFLREPGAVEDEVFAQELRDNLSWCYPYQRDTLLPAKLSVSRIKEETAPKQLFMPVEADAEKMRLAAERGTMTHLVLRHIDWKRCNNVTEIEEQLAHMVRQGLATEEQLGLVSVESIQRLAASPLGARMAAAVLNRETPFDIFLPAQRFAPQYGDSELLVQGIIDCWFVEGDGIILIDYKTDRVHGDPRRTAEKYLSQMDIYTYALEEIKKLPVRQRLIYLLDVHEAVEI